MQTRLVSLGKTQNPDTWPKENAFRELLSKILFRFSKNFKSSRNSQIKKSNGNTYFCLYKIKKKNNIGKIDKVLVIRIETTRNSRTRNVNLLRALPFFYPTIDSFKTSDTFNLKAEEQTKIIKEEHGKTYLRINKQMKMKAASITFSAFLLFRVFS